MPEVLMLTRADPLSLRLIWLLVCLVGASAAIAAEGELDLDRHCLDCHRAGQSRGDVPVIEGQQADYLRNQLADFRDLHRRGFPMAALVSGLDGDTIDRIADALSRRAWQRFDRPPAAASAERGRERIGTMPCADCHGQAFHGVGVIPRLAGQHPGYLRLQIQRFAEGQRRHPLSEVDARVYVLDVDEVRDIAAFLHSLD